MADWAIIETYGGLPENVWLAPSEWQATQKAHLVAVTGGFDRHEDGYWVDGDSEIHIREVSD